MRILTILYFITYTFAVCYIVKNIFSLFCRSSINTLYLYFIKQAVLKLRNHDKLKNKCKLETDLQQYVSQHSQKKQKNSNTN